MADLAAIQRRFYELVTTGAGVVEPGLVTGPPRLHVYAEMYVARIVDALADDYPKLRAALGADAFHELAIAYVRARPPTSFTLRDAGAELAAHLDAHGDRPPWCADLARLERARVEVFDAADAIPLARADLARIPIEAFPDFAIALVPAATLLVVRWSIDDLWSRVEGQQPIAAPVRCERIVLAWRRDGRVLHRTLDADEARLVERLRVGAELKAISNALADGPEPDRRLVELLVRWIDAGVIRPA